MEEEEEDGLLKRVTQGRQTGIEQREKWGSPFLFHFIRPLGSLVHNRMS